MLGFRSARLPNWFGAFAVILICNSCHALNGQQSQFESVRDTLFGQKSVDNSVYFEVLGQLGGQPNRPRSISDGIPNERKSENNSQPLARPEAPALDNANPPVPFKQIQSVPLMGDAPGNTLIHPPRNTSIASFGLPDHQDRHSANRKIWGRKKSSRVGRFFRGVVDGICCPDPCYQPRWTMLANASFFTDSARPQNRQRYRWDYNSNFDFQDRAEYFWAQSGTLGPDAESFIDYDEISAYVETGGDKFSVFLVTPYRAIDLASDGHFAGFADLVAGTKSLLHDTELLQVSFQFETQIPTSSPSKGLSNGHVSLEPSLLLGIALSDVSFLQAQISEWIPIGGDADHAGALLSYSTSYNRVLWNSHDRTNLVGTIEYTGVSFQDGLFTSPTTLTTESASNETFSSMGGGFRLNICDKINFGVGSLFTLTDNHWAETQIRTEFQIRY